MLRAAVIACFVTLTGASLAPGALAQAPDPALVAAAKKEGSLTWYTTQIVDQFARPAALAFEKKYGIRVNYVRADPAEIVIRIAVEAKAGDNKPTALQDSHLQKIRSRGGIALVINETNMHELREVLAWTR